MELLGVLYVITISMSRLCNVYDWPSDLKVHLAVAAVLSVVGLNSAQHNYDDCFESR